MLAGLTDDSFPSVCPLVDGFLLAGGSHNGHNVCNTQLCSLSDNQIHLLGFGNELKEPQGEAVVAS